MPGCLLEQGWKRRVKLTGPRRPVPALQGRMAGGGWQRVQAGAGCSSWSTSWGLVGCESMRQPPGSCIRHPAVGCGVSEQEGLSRLAEKGSLVKIAAFFLFGIALPSFSLQDCLRGKLNCFS